MPDLTSTTEERVALAQAFIAFCDGAEEGGLITYAQRGRMVARDLLEALQELDAERSARRAVQADRDRWRDQRWREQHGEAWAA